jgi:Raf kinase inhibitor-like YbhB/YbcL family protein
MKPNRPAVRLLPLVALAVPAVLAGCRGGEQSGLEPLGELTMDVTSTAFDDGEPIPRKHTGEGEDLSPPLVWSGVPEGTAELALVCDDPDAPTPQPWLHWVIYKIPPQTKGLVEGVPNDPELERPAGALQGKNSWDSGRTIGYRGPMPPPGHGEHRYFFKLFALDEPVDLGPGATKDQLLDAMTDHILAEGRLMGTYERK